MQKRSTRLHQIYINMATIKKRGKSWFAQVRRKGVSKSASFPTKAAAQDWANRTETEIMQGKHKVDSGRTLGDALTKYNAEVSTKKKTLQWDLTRCAMFKRNLKFIDHDVSNITTAMIAEWRDKRLKEISAGSVRRELSFLAAIFETVRREWQWIDVNPARDVKKPSLPRHRDRIYTDSEIGLICDYLGDTPTKYAVLISLETGMRRGEVAGLTWDSINLERRFITLTETKNGQKRHVPLSAKVVELLSSLPRNCNPIEASTHIISRRFREACKACGIENAHYHDIRHTAITRLSKKLTPFELARMVGHSDLKMTLLYYNESAEQIANKLD